MASEWRIEPWERQGYAVRVCRKCGDCQADVWGYYTTKELDVAQAALERAQGLTRPHTGI